VKKTTLTLSAIAGFALVACIPSVNPFYTAEDIRFDPDLVGQWTAKDSGDEPEHWRFERAEEDAETPAYNLTIMDDNGKEGHFKATLFKLKEHRFLDLIPTECEYATNQADLVAFTMFPGHLLVHVARIEPELKFAFCNFDWLADHLEQKPGALPHHQEEDRILLTASSRQLQRFVLKHVDGGELFEDYGELTKVAGPEE